MPVDPEKLVELCELAYSSPTISFDNGLEVLIDGNILAVAGTENIEDIIRDLRAFPVKDAYLGRCHAGFLKGSKDIYLKLKPHLKAGMILTGHSLGAAVATILTGYMIKKDLHPSSLVTFGSPRVGFKHLSDVVNRVVLSTKTLCATEHDDNTRIEHIIINIFMVYPFIQAGTSKQGQSFSDTSL